MTVLRSLRKGVFNALNTLFCTGSMAGPNVRESAPSCLRQPTQRRAVHPADHGSKNHRQGVFNALNTPQLHPPSVRSATSRDHSNRKPPATPGGFSI